MIGAKAASEVHLQRKVIELAQEVERLRFNGREAIAAWMFKNGYATGPGDTIEDLLIELEGQAKDRGANRAFPSTNGPSEDKRRWDQH